MSAMGVDGRLDHIVEFARQLAAEHQVAELIERIVIAARESAAADGGTIYLVDPDDRAAQFALAINQSLGIHVGGTSGHAPEFPPVTLVRTDGTPDDGSAIARCVHFHETQNVGDVYAADPSQFKAARDFDARHRYRTSSVLTVPMQDHKGRVLGVLQVVNAGAAAGTVRAFSAAEQAFIEALAAQAALAIEKKQLIERLETLFERLCTLINDAIDEKSPYTGGHCRRVPELTMMLAEAAHRTQSGPLSSFRMTERDRRELKLAGLLHDCGKITTPVHVVDKATKLATIFDRIALVDLRLTVIERDARAAMFERIAGGTPRAAAQADFAAEKAALDDDRRFLAQANIGSERMSDDDVARVERIARRRFRDHDGIERPVLNADETENLCIRYGTLTTAERQVINRHIDATIRMLEALPWPPDLVHVPEYAGGHHERMDGRGYPRGLTREQMSWQARMMGVADVFEALTAGDRPYKPAKPLSESMSILARMSAGGHIDPDLFAVFVRERVYLDYARRFLDPALIDAVDPDALLAAAAARGAPAPTAAAQRAR